MSARAISIGEVLDALKGDYPDISVSKIRFLETEGLIKPERTASGYRKFAQRDIDRLRTILKMQRDSFLPLKVIREKLAALDAGAAIAPAPEAPSAATPAPSEADAGARPAPVATTMPPLSEPPPNVRLAENDFTDATGLSLDQVRQLREFGVICEHTNGSGGAYFDGDDVAVGALALRFLSLGIEARHLKQLRRWAEQEAAMFEQLVTPAFRTRRPGDRENAVGTLSELATLSHALRHTYVRQSLRAVINGAS